jgi:PAS domain S-box-containing protein
VAPRPTIDARLQAAVASAPAGIARVTLSGRWISFNDACTTILGYSRAELARLTLHDLTHRDDAAREVQLMREMLEGRARSYRIAKRIAGKNGSTRVIHLTAVVVRGAAAEEDSFLYVIEEAAWRAEIDPLNHRVAADVVDQLAWTAIVWTDEHDVITGWNQGAERLFGIGRTDAIGKQRRELFCEQDRAAGMAEEQLATAERRGRFSDTGWRRKRDGSPVRVHTSLVRLTPDGVTRGYVEELTTNSETLARQKTEAVLQEHRLEIRKKVSDVEQRAAEYQRELAVLAKSLGEEVARRKAAEAELETLKAQALANVELDIPLEEEIVVTRQGAVVVDEASIEWRDADSRSVTDLITAAANGMRSGVLILQSEQYRGEIFFERGRIAATTSDDPDSLLGEWMVRRGLIAESARRKALEMCDFAEIALGRSLLALGVLTKDQIIEAVREKIESDVERCGRLQIIRWAFVHSATTRTLVPIGVDPRELRAMQTFVALPDGKRYHLPSCTSIGRASTPVMLTVSAAGERGLAPCRRCLAAPTETAAAAPVAS